MMADLLRIKIFHGECPGRKNPRFSVMRRVGNNFGQ